MPLRPNQKKQAEVTAFQPLSAFKYDTETKENSFYWEQKIAMKKTATTYETAVATAATKQQATLTGLESLVDLNSINLDKLNTLEGQQAAFLVAPKTMEFTSNTVRHAA